MSPVQNIWRQLVQRRLWPVAIVLVAALAAVPVMLAKDPEPVPPPPAPAAVSADDELAAEPIVAMASAEETANRTKVLGKKKNPFAVDKDEPATESTDTSDSVVTTTATHDDDTTSGSDSGSAGDTPSGGGSTPAPAPTTPVEPAPKPKVYAAGELTVRFGSGDGTQRQSLKKGEALPSADDPVLIYTGLADHGKYAVFLVSDGLAPVGDGDCLPSADLCEELRLRTGETEFFDVTTDESDTVSGGFQLDLVKIHKGTGGASASRRTASAKPRAAQAQELRADGPATELRSSVGAVVARLP